eukprot:gene2481-4827_t
MPSSTSLSDSGSDQENCKFGNDEARSDSHNSKKRKRANAKLNEQMENDIASSNIKPEPVDPRLYGMEFPKHLEGEFAAAIFDLGLKLASPKILMQLMPEYESLTTEHIKSHLQKYRIHGDRSKEEFLQYYEENMRDLFQQFESNKGWERLSGPMDKLPLARKRQTDPLDEYEDIMSGKTNPSEVILEQAEMMMAEWGTLFENLMSEHAHIQHTLNTAITVDNSNNDNKLTIQMKPSLLSSSPFLLSSDEYLLNNNNSSYPLNNLNHAHNMLPNSTTSTTLIPHSTALPQATELTSSTGGMMDWCNSNSNSNYILPTVSLNAQGVYSITPSTMPLAAAVPFPDAYPFLSYSKYFDGMPTVNASTCT